MSFIRRKIDLIFRLGTGDFGEAGANTVKVSGLRVQATVQTVEGPMNGQAQFRIYGLTPSIMNKLAGLNVGTNPTMQRKNDVIVMAGDDKSGMAVVFGGQIIFCQIDLNTQPESVLNVIANAGLYEGVKAAYPTSYGDYVDAAFVMKNLATKMGLAFENSGVQGIMLRKPYYPGTLLDQMKKCAQAANINAFIENGSTLVIYPMNGSRNGAAILISPKTGMIGYPSYLGVKAGVAIRTIFNPSLKQGIPVQVESIIEVARSRWRIYKLVHELESEVPNGAWMTSFEASIYDQTK
jgi:hypothetical protein